MIRTVGLVVLLTAATGNAQNTGSMSGRVVDITDALVPNTRIELTRGQQHFEALTNGLGEFYIEGLAAGDYNLLAIQPGFRFFRVTALSLAAGQALRLPDLALKVGGMCDATPSPELTLLSNTASGSIAVRLNQVRYGASDPSPVADREVLLMGPDSEIIRGKTDASGSFLAQDLKSGKYRIQAGIDVDYHLIAGWGATFDLQWLPERCPAEGCDAERPPREFPLTVCE